MTKVYLVWVNDSVEYVCATYAGAAKRAKELMSRAADYPWKGGEDKLGGSARWYQKVDVASMMKGPAVARLEVQPWLIDFTLGDKER